MIKIYADGSCLGNPGPGGWAAILLQEGERLELKGSEPDTTSNRMELTAAIQGLSRTPENAEVIVYSDSQYLVKTMSAGQKRRKNRDLWQQLDKLSEARKVNWVWLRGHAGHPENEQAHQLAQEMAGRAQRPAHFDSSGEVHMVDVLEKAPTLRVAVARGKIAMQPSTLELIKRGQAAKGNVLAVAQVAGILAAKRTHELIPLCHPLRLSHISLEFDLDEEKGEVGVAATVRATERTGVEMEALTAVAVSLLTIYDMCKAVDRGMKIQEIRLARKSGGKSGEIVLE